MTDALDQPGAPVDHRWWPRIAIGLLVAVASACVPEGPRTREEPVRSTKSAQSAEAKPSLQSPPILSPFEERFDRERLGNTWMSLSSVWRISKGELCGRNARNRGVWLRRSLPTNASIEFDARSESPEGDIKAEFWGDGRSGASAASYSDATSYLTILGGWKNTKHVLARLDEHGRDRLELDVEPGSQDLQTRPVQAGQTYHFKVERTDGKTVRWWVDDRLMFEMTDPEPLTGPDHNHFGFNNWTVPVCFDNLSITPL